MDEISETLLPYALNNSSVCGRRPVNKAPSFLAVLCNVPSSASAFLLREMVVPRSAYSAGTSSLTSVKSKLLFNRATEFSLYRVLMEAVTRPTVPAMFISLRIRSIRDC